MKYGKPSASQFLEGFMEKKGRTKADFRGLFNFNIREANINYSLLQSSVKVIAETLNWNPGHMTMPEMHGGSDDPYASVYLKIHDSNNASIVVSILEKDTGVNETELSFTYSTERFPSILLYYTHNNKRERLDGELKDQVLRDPSYATVIINFLIKYLYEAYEVKHEHDE